ncbi:DUF418 domain-containing protein [Streptomyces iakyrus]|uniref:DUF418 domain-containing protein n=1 Tax=Streptomyces iakyrus TaxID=68219 RepID=UPI00383AF824
MALGTALTLTGTPVVPILFLSYGQADGLVSLFFTGGYPALTWVPFVIAGMAVARLDLATTTVRIRLALTGVALAVTGYGGSWQALRLVPGAAEAVRKAEEGPGMSSMSSVSPDSIGIFGDSPAGMLAAAPHSEATLSIVGNTGVAVLVITACMVAMDAFPRLRRLAGPVIAVGSMSLTAYVFHIVAIWLLDTEEATVPRFYVLLGFIASVTVLAALWSRFFQRGPLEWLMARATGITRRIQ